LSPTGSLVDILPWESCISPNLSPSPALSYFTGAFVGDGALIRSASYHYELRLRVRDHEFAEKVCDCLSAFLGKRKEVKLDKEGFFEVRTWSGLLYEYASTPNVYYRVAQKFPADFIRGLADAEGSSAASVSRSTNPRLGSYIVLVNTNLDLLFFVRKLLRINFRIRSTILLGKKRHNMWSKVSCYYLKIGRRKDQWHFAKHIGFGIERKQSKMLDALSLPDRLGPSRAAVQWSRMYNNGGGMLPPRDETHNE
jgi:intein-encoded DNA endonuclease-like protein